MKSKRAQARMDELLSAYIDGELSPKERTRLEARLAADPDLRKRLETLRHTVALVRDLPRVQAPRNFLITSTMVAPARPQPTVRRWLAPGLTFATAASALLCTVVLAGGLLASGLSGLGATAPAAEPAYEVAVEQAEDEETLRAAAPTEAHYFAEEEAVVEEPSERTGQEGEVPLPAEEVPPAPTVETDLAPTEEVTGTPAAPQAVGGGPTPTSTPSLPTAAPENGAAATETLPPPPVGQAAQVASPTPSYTPTSGALPEPTSQVREPPAVLPNTLWLLTVGLGVLTLSLAVASALAWRARRR